MRIVAHAAWGVQFFQPGRLLNRFLVQLQGGLPFLAQPQTGPGGAVPTNLQQQGPPLLPGQALAQNPAGVAGSAPLAASQDTGGGPSLVSVVYDGYLSDCTVSLCFQNLLS